LKWLKATGTFVLFNDIIRSPAFSRIRELPKCNGAHNSLSGVLQPSTKKKNRARNFLQLSPKQPASSYSSAHFHNVYDPKCLSAAFITTLTLGILLFC